MLRNTEKQRKIISLYLKGRKANKKVAYSEIAYKTQSAELYVRRIIKAHENAKS